MSDRRTWKDLIFDLLPAQPSTLTSIYTLVANVLGIVPPLPPNRQAKVRQVLQRLRDDKKARHWAGGLWASAQTQALCKCGASLPWTIDVVGVGPMAYACTCARSYVWTGPLEERRLIEAMKPQDDGRPTERRLLLFALLDTNGIDRDPLDLVAGLYGYELSVIQKETVAARLGDIRADAVVIMTGGISHQLGGHGRRIAKEAGAPIELIHSGFSVTGLSQALGAIERAGDPRCGIK